MQTGHNTKAAIRLVARLLQKQFMKAAARTALSLTGHGRCRHDAARVSEVHSCCLRKDHLVNRQIGHSAATPGILGHEILNLRDLIGSQPAELLVPAAICHLGHANRADRIRDGFALRDQDIDLPQFRDDLFEFVMLSRHGSIPSRCHKTYLKLDQFGGGGSLRQTLGRFRPERISNRIKSRVQCHADRIQ